MGDPVVVWGAKAGEQRDGRTEVICGGDRPALRLRQHKDERLTGHFGQQQHRGAEDSGIGGHVAHQCEALELEPRAQRQSAGDERADAGKGRDAPCRTGSTVVAVGETHLDPRPVVERPEEPGASRVLRLSELTNGQIGLGKP